MDASDSLIEEVTPPVVYPRGIRPSGDAEHPR